MNKKLLILLLVLMALLVISMIGVTYFGNHFSNNGSNSNKKVESITTKSGQRVTYTTQVIDGMWVHSMAWDSETVWATTSSSQNPFLSCRDDFVTTRPEIKENEASSTSGWSNFNENGYSFSLKYPSSWVIQKKNMDGRTIIDLVKDNHVLEIQKGGSGMTGSVCNQADYYSMRIGDNNISRPKQFSAFEEGQEKYFSLCTISDIGNGGQCDGGIEISPGNTIGITYLLPKEYSFDPGLVNEMDLIVGTIRPKN